MEPDETTRLLKDLVWLNAVIATELIQITENTSAILRHGEIPESCRVEHRSLSASVRAPCWRSTFPPINNLLFLRARSTVVP
jgi:hypothetical protein